MSSKLVLVLNCGSSSLKFAILDAVNGDEYLSGLAECFHLPEARIKWKMDGSKQEAELGAGAAHSEALNFIVNTILAQKPELSAQLTAPTIVSFTAVRNTPAPLLSMTPSFRALKIPHLSLRCTTLRT